MYGVLYANYESEGVTYVVNGPYTESMAKMLVEYNDEFDAATLVELWEVPTDE